jgi:hypothetical protein
MDNCLQRSAMKKDLIQNLFQFIRVMVDLQAYLNVGYLVIAFPLGVFYFVFLVSGLSLGLSTVIIWVGIPILLLVIVVWSALGDLERYMAIHWLKEDFSMLISLPKKGVDIWTRFKEFLTNPLTWKCMIYLFLKFPLGIATFVIMVVLVSLTLGFLTAPITYRLLPDFQIGISLRAGLPQWHIDSLNDALIGMLVGLVLWPLTLQVTNGLAWIHAKFARVMLDPC